MRDKTISISVKNIPSRDIGFKKYVESGSWQCPKGGAHFWLHIEGKTWRCGKCHQPRDFDCPEYVWNDRGDARTPFGVSGIFDIMQKGLG